MALISILSCSRIFGKKYTIAKLEISAGREILILSDYYYENDRKYYYQVIANGETKVPPTFICTGGDPNKLRFEILPGKQREIVAVVESQKPSEVVILHDFVSGETWPHALPSESSEEHKSKGLKLLQKLQPEKPTEALKLSESQCG
jgi:hypothetical protein